MVNNARRKIRNRGGFTACNVTVVSVVVKSQSYLSRKQLRFAAKTFTPVGRLGFVGLSEEGPKV